MTPHTFHFLTFIVSLNIVEHPQNKLVPVVVYVIAAVNGRSPHWHHFFFSLEVRRNRCASLSCSWEPQAGVNSCDLKTSEKLQLYRWPLQSSSTGDSFRKRLNRRLLRENHITWPYQQLHTCVYTLVVYSKKVLCNSSTQDLAWKGVGARNVRLHNTGQRGTERPGVTIARHLAKVRS